MIEDGGAYPSRGEPGAGAVPPGPPRYPEWPSAGHAPDAGDQPTDVYAALSDLAAGDVAPGEILVPPPGHGQPVPRDFVPPQVTWSPAPEPLYFDGSPQYPDGSPLYFDGSLVHGPADPAPAAPIERFEQRREDWRPAYQPPAPRRPFEAGPPVAPPPDAGPAVDWLPAAETEVFDGPLIDLSAPRALPVTHRGRRRRGRTVVAVAAAGALLAGATGYMLLRGLGVGPATHTDASRPLVTAAPTASPATGSGAPIGPVSIPPSASARRATSAAAAPSRTAAATTAPAVTSTLTQGTEPSPPATATPTQTATPLAGRPAPSVTPTSGTAELTAGFRSQQSNGGYLGTVTLTNRGTTAVGNWTVRITAPGATAVVVVGSGVSATRSGNTLTFTPSSGAAPIAAGGSLAYAFAVSGSTSAPSGCQVNGTACG